MVLCGGLEIIAGAYFYNEYTKSKESRRRREEEQYERNRRRRRRHSHDGHKRPHVSHEKSAHRPSSSRPQPVPTPTPSNSKFTSGSHSSLAPPSNQGFRPGSAPPGFVQPMANGQKPQYPPHLQNSTQLRQEDRYVAPNRRAQPYPSYSLQQSAKPPFQAQRPIQTQSPSFTSPRPEKSAAVQSSTPYPARLLQQQAAPQAASPPPSNYVVPPEGVYEMMSGDLHHPNPASLRRTSGRTARPHVHFEDDPEAQYRRQDIPPPPYTER